MALTADDASLLPRNVGPGFHSLRSYDLNLAILTHCTNGNWERISAMKRLGAVNPGRFKVHITLLVNPGDFGYLEELKKGWICTDDLTVLEMPSPHPVPKINGYYLWLMRCGLSARWHGRVDDDSITDISEALTYLDKCHGRKAVHVATSPLRHEIGPLFIPYLLQKGIFLNSTSIEYESSFTSDSAMSKIFSDQRALSMIIETGRLFQTPGDRALALAAHLADVPVVANEHATWKFLPEDLSFLGGNLHHIHYVPWKNREFVEILGPFVASSSRGLDRRQLESILGWPLCFHIGRQSSAVLTLAHDGEVIGGGEIDVAKWIFDGGRLSLASSSGVVISTFWECCGEDSPIALRGGGKPSGPSHVLRIPDLPELEPLIGPTSVRSAPTCPPRRMWYFRMGYDRRVLSLEHDGSIQEGRAANEMRWRMAGNPKDVLEIEGEKGITCRLAASGDGVWRGKWLIGERMPIALIPIQDHPVEEHP